MPEGNLRAEKMFMIKNVIAIACAMIIGTCVFLLALLPSNVSVVATVFLSLTIAGSSTYILYVVIAQLFYLLKRNPPAADVEMGPVNLIMDRSAYLHPITIDRPREMPWSRTSRRGNTSSNSHVANVEMGPSYQIMDRSTYLHPLEISKPKKMPWSRTPRRGNASRNAPVMPPVVFSSVRSESRSESSSFDGRRTQPSPESGASASGVTDFAEASTSAQVARENETLTVGTHSYGAIASEVDARPTISSEPVNEFPSTSKSSKRINSPISDNGESEKSSKPVSDVESPSVKENTKETSVSSFCSSPSSTKSESPGSPL